MTRMDVPTHGGTMTETNGENGNEHPDSRQRWLEDVQAALDRTGDAIRTAWESTRESRMSALESAKQAAQDLGDAIDKGLAAAKERWAETSEGSTANEEE